MKPWVRAYIGLGSNLDDPESQLRKGFAALTALAGCRDLLASDLYLSRPFGDIDQPNFVNAVVGMETRLSPQGLLSALQGIEHCQGRTRELRWGPRTLDLDILLYDREIVDQPDLIIPHPGLLQRDFVLYPLFEIASEIVIPGHGHIRDCLAACTNRGLQRLHRTPLSGARDDEGTIIGAT